MKIKITKKNDDFHLEAENETGKTLSMDAYESVGGKNLGFKPLELFPTALGGCSAIDVISILKKQKQEITDLQITVEGKRETGKTANLFIQFYIHFAFTGKVSREKAEKAILLSLEKYCTAVKILEKSAVVNFSLSVNGE